MSKREKDKMIQSHISDSLTGQDIMDLIGNKARIYSYPELSEFKNIDQALGPNKAMIVLYETRKDYGHWTCIFKHHDDLIEHFDSYGVRPDDELKFIDENFRQENNEKRPHLSFLLSKWLSKSKNRKVIYNAYNLQKMKSGTNTCGRFVAMRLLLRDIPLQQFISFLNNELSKKKDADWIVTFLTTV